MNFGHEDRDYGFRKGHWFEFKGRRVAVTFNKTDEPEADQIVEVLVEAMITTRISEYLDGMPIIGDWRRFKKWRRKIAKQKQMARRERALARVLALSNKWNLDLRVPGEDD